MREHVPPVVPIVPAPLAVVEEMRDALRVEQVREVEVAVAAAVAVAGAEHDAHAADLVEEPRVVQVGQVVDRVGEVAVVVEITVEERPDVERPAQAEAVADEVGVAQGEVDRVVAAEAGAGQAHPAVAGLAHGVGQDVVEDDILVGEVGPDAVGRVDGLVIPALLVDAVGAVDLDPAGVDLVGDRAHEAEVLVLVIAAERGGKQDDRVARVAEDQHLEFPAQVSRIPADVLFVHGGDGPRRETGAPPLSRNNRAGSTPDRGGTGPPDRFVRGAS